ncbi:MAG: TRAP transporter substrate-binding protein [Verrucomicrobiales bacterium]
MPAPIEESPAAPTGILGARLSLFAGGVLVGLLLATVCFAVLMRSENGEGSASSGRTTLKLAHSLDPAHPVHLAMLRMAERVVELSGDTMRIDIYPSGQLGSETECIEQLQNGQLAMTKTSSAPLEGFVEEMKVFGLPYLFESEDHLWKTLNGEIGEELLTCAEGSGLHGLCYYDAGSRNFYSKTRMIRTPDDLRGMKIRVQSSPVAMKMVEALGGSPTPIAWGELYSALAQGVVDGAENNPPSFVSNKHSEVCKFFTLDAHTRVPDLLLISTAVWKSLTSEQRQWLKQAAMDSSTYQRELWAEKSHESLERAKSKEGVEVFEPDIALFMKKVEPVYDEFARGVVGELVERIRSVK